MTANRPGLFQLDPTRPVINLMGWVWFQNQPQPNRRDGFGYGFYGKKQRDLTLPTFSSPYKLTLYFLSPKKTLPLTFTVAASSPRDPAFLLFRFLFLPPLLLQISWKSSS